MSLTLTPAASLSGYALDFIALDGSVALSLNANNASPGASVGELTWAVAGQPWQDGDLLMLRIRETDGGPKATPTPAPTAAPTPLPTATPAPTPTPTPDASQLPSLSVSDASAVEAGYLTFTVRVSQEWPGSILVNYDSRDGTAKFPSDYTRAWGSLYFPPFETEKTVQTFTWPGSGAPEEDETMELVLSAPIGATIADAVGVGAILVRD